MEKKTVMEIKDLWKTISFGQEQVTLLKDISLNIKEGEFVAIVGPSGSGKSTLLNILGCLDVYNKGSYKLLGNEVEKQSTDDLAALRQKTLGFIFQSFNLIPDLTTLENVMVPHIYAEIYDESKGRELLKRVGLSEKSGHLPSQLSGGQKQRVAIARALMNEPSILLADEPTGNLDSKSGEIVFSLIKELHNEGKTVILVTHDPNLAKQTERTITVKDGVIV